MNKTLAKTETPRETFRIEERWTDGTIAHSWHLDGADLAEAWRWFETYRGLYPWRYTPHSPRRLVLLTVGGAR